MSETKLDQAAREMREARIHRDVLDRAERAVLSRVGRRPAFVRPLLLGASGLAALAVAAVVLTPARASASDLLRIVGNADKALRHVRFSVAQPDGSLKLGQEMFLQDGKRRFQFETGEFAVYDGKALYRRDRDGVVTLERTPPGTPYSPMGEEGSARDLLAINATGEGVKISVERGALDRYTVDRDLVDIHGTTQHLRLVLEADPKTERPLSLRATTTGWAERVTTWDYPAPDPSLFRPLKVDYDLDAQRTEVLRQLRAPGRKATVGGKTVELAGLWVDELGNASALAYADYAYPMDYGLKIDGVATRVPEKPPFSGQWVVEEPSMFEGRRVQSFIQVRPDRAGKLHYPDRVSLQLPICEGKRLLGYARFENVPVHRAYKTYFLKPDNRFFWDKGPRVGSQATKAVEDSSQP